MKTKLLLLMMVLLGIAAGAKADNVKIGNYELGVGDYYSRESGLIGLERGYIHYDDASHLTLENVELCFNTVEGLSAAILYLGGHLTITLIGENKIYGAAIPTGITSTGLTIDGTGSLDIVATNSGIFVALENDNLVIDNAHVKTKGGTYGIRGIGYSGWDSNGPTYKSTGLRIHGDGILEAYGGTQCFYAIDGRGASGAAIMSPSGARFSDSGSVVDASNNPIKNQWVTIKNGILVNSTNFPDANFRNWVLAQTYGTDGILTDAEIANVTSIRVDRKNIADLKGIESFTALKELSCALNQLTTLNVSTNTRLESLYCDNNQLTALDISTNTKLRRLWCDNNQLTTLDVSKNTALESLTCGNNQLTTLDVSKNTTLLSISCGSNQLTTLDVSNNRALETLSCYGNAIRDEGMQTLVNSLPDRRETSNGTLIVYYDETPGDNEMTVLQVEAAKLKNWKVQMFNHGWMDYPGVEPGLPINATNFPDENFREWVLRKFGADGYLTDAEIANVTEINLSRTRISDLTGIEHFTALENLWCYECELTTLDVSKNTALELLNCRANNLTSLNVSKNAALQYLYCEQNNLTSLDVSGCTALIELICGGNNLTTLDISKNAELTKLDCFGNGISGEGMQTLVNNLFDRRTTSSGKLYVYISNINDLYVNNEMTAFQVAAAKAKNWQVLRLNYSSDWVDYPGVVSTITLNQFEVAVEKGKTVTLKATVSSEVEDKSVTWKSSNTSVATVTNKGVVKGIAGGIATITCTSVATGQSAACKVIVGKVSLSKYEAAVEKGKTVTLTATVYPSSLSDRSVTWKSSNTSVATVTSDGKVTGVGGGTATITGTSVATGLSATCKVTVGKVSLGKSEVAVEKGKTVTLTATVYPSTLEDKSVTWKSSKTSVATVTSKGVVKGIGGGTATITCTSVATGFTATCKVTVGKVSLSKSEVFVEKGKTTTLTATVYPSTLEDKSVTWKSSNTAVATVNRAGVVTGVGGGTATITGTSNATGFTATCKVTVGKVSLSKYEVAVEKGKTVTLTATVYPSSLSDRSVTWKSSSTSVATVSSDGKVTGVGGGTATITCTSVATGFTATCKVTVGKVSLSKYEVAVEKGKTVTLTATVYPSSLENKSVTWKSSNTAVATVTSDGKVKGVAGGTATITCTSVATGFTATCQVTVTESANARTLDGDDEEVTGIETVEETPAVEEPFDVYDLRGRKVLQRVTSLDGLPDGIYIVNGKKMLKK